ncbi:hypothetical protein RN001_004731 [Aquatica leii]|uniref:Uncharacterized protein n=1 Tax=Aquatica leii TaxID=1421715 RepID=A0AAN7PB40_9COLE|nr:hypothetical protein RN001_004731 [Aquatica leii]
MKSQYENDVVLKNMSLIGIREFCIWNNISSFHVSENFSVNISHDIFEGVAVFDIYFNYGKQNNNKPPLISLDNLRKKKIKMNCAEMKSFVLYFGIIYGLLIQNNNKHWELYTLLRKILAIVLSSEFDFVGLDQTCSLLQNLVYARHKLYQDLFKLNLKPNHHILVHYPSIIRTVGSLNQLSTLSFESKHRASKQAVNVVSSRINITHTLLLKIN